MRILIDCSNLRLGGGIQVAISFLSDLSQMNLSDDYIVALSPEMEKLLNRDSIKNLKLISLPQTQSVRKRSSFVKSLEIKEKVDVVFVVFGPSYHRSRVPKIVGYAIPHYIYEDSPFFTIISRKEKILHYFRKVLKTRLFKNYSDRLVFETNDARIRFSEKFNYREADTYVVSNTLNKIFYTPELWKERVFDFNAKNIFLCLTANYKHKNLIIIPKVIDLLIDSGINDFKFVISLSKESLSFDNKYDKYIEYLGHVRLEELPSLYKAVDILFMPTLLEVFSTTYLEGMYMKIPIITTDLSFTRDICQDCALYFDPINVQDCTNKLRQLIQDKELQNELVEKGLNNLKRFGTSDDRTKQYLEIILETVKK